MTKTRIIVLIAEFIPLILFNLIFFLLGGTEHSISVWISYGFIHFAYIMLLLTPFLVSKGKSAPVFGYSLNVISGVYVIFELILGLIFIFIALEDILPPLLIQAVVAGIYLVIFLSHVAANEATSSAERKRTVEILFIKSTANEVKSLMSVSGDPDINKYVESLYDTLNSSPTKSHPDVSFLEQEISSEINKLARAVNSSDVVAVKETVVSIQRKISERNRVLRLLQ